MASYVATGGRSSSSGIRATVFGATGFLGRYVVNRLGKIGSRTLVPYRGDEIITRPLKVSGDLGQVSFFDMSIRNIDQIQEAIAESNVVINLMAARHETRRWTFSDVNATFPAVLAELCAEQGIERLVHVSALGASTDSPSAWAVSKAVGEANVLEAFPSATIVRPATIFGDEDRFLNRIARFGKNFPFIPLLSPQAKEQPVYCDDVAAAIVECVVNPQRAGQTYTLAGPKVYTNQQIHDKVFAVMDERSNAYEVPESVGMALALGLEQLPNPRLTRDNLYLQSTDRTMPDGVAGLAELGITPTAMEDVCERYLLMYRTRSVMEEEEGIVQPPTNTL